MKNARRSEAEEPSLLQKLYAQTTHAMDSATLRRACASVLTSAEVAEVGDDLRALCTDAEKLQLAVARLLHAAAPAALPADAVEDSARARKGGIAARHRNATTLAEALKAAGYPGAVAFSALQYPQERESRRLLEWLAERALEVAGVGVEGGGGESSSTSSGAAGAGTWRYWLEATERALREAADGSGGVGEAGATAAAAAAAIAEAGGSAAASGHASVWGAAATRAAVLHRERAAKRRERGGADLDPETEARVRALLAERDALMARYKEGQEVRIPALQAAIAAAHAESEGLEGQYLQVERLVALVTGPDGGAAAAAAKESLLAAHAAHVAALEAIDAAASPACEVLSRDIAAVVATASSDVPEKIAQAKADLDALRVRAAGAVADYDGLQGQVAELRRRLQRLLGDDDAAGGEDGSSSGSASGAGAVDGSVRVVGGVALPSTDLALVPGTRAFYLRRLAEAARQVSRQRSEIAKARADSVAGRAAVEAAAAADAATTSKVLSALTVAAEENLRDADRRTVLRLAVEVKEGFAALTASAEAQLQLEQETAALEARAAQGGPPRTEELAADLAALLAENEALAAAAATAAGAAP